MRIERINPYGHRLAELSKKVKSELSEAEKSLPDERAMVKRIGEQEKLKKAIEQMKYEQKKMKQAGESMRAEQEGMKILLTCFEISRRIINGDEVPPKDHKYLMEHNMELYTKSIMMRRHKDNPHEYDQLSEDEKTDKPQSVTDTETSSCSESFASGHELDVSV